MNAYLEYVDSRGREIRIRVQINHAERAKQALPFEGTLCMSKYEIRSRISEARVYNLGVR